MPVIQLNARAVAYQVDGERHKPCLMFSNSLGADLRMWQAQAAFFERDFRVIRYDTRGHGASGTGDASVTLDQLGQDVLALLDALDVERVHFCGLSMGGAIAQWLGVHAPQRLQRLVIANSAARIGTPQGWRERAVQVRASGLGAVADGAAGRWFTPAYIGREPQRVASLVATLRTGSPEGYAACCDALADEDLSGQLSRITAPTLLMAGADDPVTTVADAIAMQQAISGAAMVTLNASHLSNVEAEAAFNLALREFLHS